MFRRVARGLSGQGSLTALPEKFELVERAWTSIAPICTLKVVNAKGSKLSGITGCPQPDGGRAALISSAKTIFMVWVLIEREATRDYPVSTREPWNKEQPIMMSKDAAPIISFPMKNPTIGTVNTA